MMRTIFKSGICLLVLMAVAFGCENGSDQDKSAPQRMTSSSPIAGQPEDFFPTQVGLTWTYVITLAADAEPIYYYETAWPLGDKSILYATRGRFLPTLKGDGKKRFSFIIRSKAIAMKQGPLKYPYNDVCY